MHRSGKPRLDNPRSRLSILVAKATQSRANLVYQGVNTSTQTPEQLSRLRKLVAVAMRAQDDFVLRFVYRDRKGSLTRRTVSPVRFIRSGGSEYFAALCLCREEVRQFVLSQCSEPVLIRAWEVLMPVEIEVVEPGVQRDGSDEC